MPYKQEVAGSSPASPTTSAKLVPNSHGGNDCRSRWSRAVRPTWQPRAASRLTPELALFQRFFGQNRGRFTLSSLWPLVKLSKSVCRRKLGLFLAFSAQFAPTHHDSPSRRQGRQEQRRRRRQDTPSPRTPFKNSKAEHRSPGPLTCHRRTAHARTGHIRSS